MLGKRHLSGDEAPEPAAKAAWDCMMRCFPCRYTDVQGPLMTTPIVFHAVHGYGSIYAF